MAKRDRGIYEVGFGKPPRSRQFKPGQSGNPAGRPRGAKNFATAIEQELKSRVIITENGRRKRISKREVIAKHLVNKAAGGDLKAIPLLLNEARAHEYHAAEAGPDHAFDTPEDRAVFDNIIARIRSSSPEGMPSAPAEQDEPEAIRRSSDEAGK
jgi:uncharacterized protein DUF5681